MTAEERSKLLNYLEASRQEFLLSVDEIAEGQWRWKPDSGRWSIAEVAEHILIAESAIFQNVRRMIGAGVNPDWEAVAHGQTEKLEARLAARAGRAQAPERLLPKGKITRHQVAERFEKLRAQIVPFASETDAPLRCYTTENPFFGTLNAYQWLL